MDILKATEACALLDQQAEQQRGAQHGARVQLTLALRGCVATASFGFFSVARYPPHSQPTAKPAATCQYEYVR